MTCRVTVDAGPRPWTAGFASAVDGVDVFANAAAWVGFGDASRATAINVDGPTELFRAAASAAVSRFAQLSTCGVLGLNLKSPIDGRRRSNRSPRE